MGLYNRVVTKKDKASSAMPHGKAPGTSWTETEEDQKSGGAPIRPDQQIGEDEKKKRSMSF